MSSSSTWYTTPDWKEHLPGDNTGWGDDSLREMDVPSAVLLRCLFIRFPVHALLYDTKNDEAFKITRPILQPSVCCCCCCCYDYFCTRELALLVLHSTAA